MGHTDRYKLNLKSLKEGRHEFAFLLDRDYFQDIEGSPILEGEVDAEVVVTARGALYDLTILVDGYITTRCDRCLAPLEMEVYNERTLIVKLGAEYLEESDECVIIPAREGVLDLSWMLYEDVVLSLPMQRMHPDGACEESMARLYRELSTQRLASDQDGVERDDEGIDQRWAALKQLKVDQTKGE